MPAQLSDIIVEENFLTREQTHYLWEEIKNNYVKQSVDFVDKWGVFKDQLVARQTFIKQGDSPYDYYSYPKTLQLVLDKISDYFNKPIVREIVYQTLYLPWDIHCDLTREDQGIPYYNILIPFHDVDSRTIMFDQTSHEYNDFYMYKQNNPKLENPVDEETWNEHLSMCWPEDRNWLTIKKLMPYQRAGQLHAFRRHYFHSSDNFHTKGIKEKQFLQILLDENKNGS